MLSIGCNAMYSENILPPFRRNLLAVSSGLRHQVSAKRRDISTRLHGATTRKTMFWTHVWYQWTQFICAWIYRSKCPQRNGIQI